MTGVQTCALPISFLDELEAKLRFSEDPRIKLVGTVYDQELLKKIRESAFAYIHGHEVGGTNPSLLEALASTQLNLLLDVGFNREVAEDAALYWDKGRGSLSALIAGIERFDTDLIRRYSMRSSDAIKARYSWNDIACRYEALIEQSV